MMSKIKKPQVPLRRSQRTIVSVFQKMAERSGEGSEEVEIVDCDSPTPRAGGSGAQESHSAPPSPSSSRSSSPEPPLTVLQHPPSRDESDAPGPSSALTGRSTRTAPRFELTEPFLTQLDEYLASRMGGTKEPAQRKEICVDISKFHYFNNPKACNPDHLMFRASIHKYVAWLEDGGIGASGVATKLRRIQMAIKCLGLQHEDLESEVHFNDMKEKVSGVLASYITSLGRQRRKTQAAKLDEFAHHIPDLNDISDFISSRRVEKFVDATIATARSGGEVSDSTRGVYVSHIGPPDAEVNTKLYLS